MLCENQHETPSNLYSSQDPLPVNETIGENSLLPTLTENPTEGLQKEDFFNESEEIQSIMVFFYFEFMYNKAKETFLFISINVNSWFHVGEIEKLRRRDEEECRRKQIYIRSRIDQHLSQNGGDLSLLLSQHTVPNEVKCVQLTRFSQTKNISKNIRTDKVPLPLPIKDQVLIRSHSW